KTHDRAGHLFDATKSFIRPPSRRRKHLQRLRLKKIARRVDAIDANIVKSPAAFLRLYSNVSGLYLERKQRAEHARLTQPARLQQFDSLEIRRIEVEPVGRHQLDATATAFGNHSLTLLGRKSERFFAQHMHARAGS